MSSFAEPTSVDGPIPDRREKPKPGLHIPGPAGVVSAPRFASESDLDHAIEKDSIEEIKRLIGEGVDINGRPGSFVSPLYRAVVRGNRDIVEILLAARADPNGNSRWETTLEAALKYNFLDIAKLLLVAGADVDQLQASPDRQTPLQFAVKKKSAEMVKLLLDVGADANRRGGNKNDGTALTIAVSSGSVEIVTLLLAAGADPNISTIGLFTPMECAVKRNSMEMVKLLVNKGCDLTHHGDKGWTVFHTLCATKEIPILKYLLTLGGNGKNEGNPDGATPMHLAVKNQDLTCIMLLIAAEVNLDIQDNRQNTPLGVALELSNGELVRVLLKAGARTDNLPTDIWTRLRSADCMRETGEGIVLSGGRGQPTAVESYITETCDSPWGGLSDKRSFYFPM